MEGLTEFAEVIVTPVAGDTAQLWVTPAVPVWVKTCEVPWHIVVLSGVKAADKAETTVTVTAFVKVLHGVWTVQE
jgi:hypothetical protein